MPNSLKLHKRYGLNPTLSTCFYCGKETGEIALLGAGYDGEAPMHLCTSIEPCPECKAKFNGYVLLIEATQDNKGKPQPTGRWFAVKKEHVKVPNNGICFIEQSIYSQLVQKVG